MTTIDLQYPVRHCHFCDNLMFYNRYENGEHYAYCNHPVHTSCMGFSYCVINHNVRIKEFAVAHTDIIYFRARLDAEAQPTSQLLIANADGEPRSVLNLFQPDLQTILSKTDSLKLLEKIRKVILVMD